MNIIVYVRAAVRTVTRSFMGVYPEADVAALAHVRVIRGAGGTVGRRTVRALAHIRCVRERG